jgi:uncharacterized glyoxalase superfamily protein PhnB
MTSIQPELWVDGAGAAIAFYEEAFGARVMHRVGVGDDIVAQLTVGDEHGWRLGRIIDPFGHEWEVGRPLGPWPPA